MKHITPHIDTYATLKETNTQLTCCSVIEPRITTMTNTSNPYLASIHYKDDNLQQIQIDCERINHLLTQHESGEISLLAEDIKDLRQQAEAIEIREMMVKGYLKEQMDTCLGGVEIDNLTQVANCKKMAMHLNSTPSVTMKKCLRDQFAALHKLTMLSIHQSENALNKFGNDEIAIKFNNTAIKASKACANIVLALDKLENGGKQKIEVKHQYVQVNEGGQAVIANDLNQGGHYEK